ncbi:PREDICTED: uncharacterized protein LOC108758511, partial [Trachymyrmex cornetzi]|uniref:uncharacterized protein LOC108758511 n=1 Tax=Trachymyrmex cornetzi TaxID=471704 RepID=UPI00084F38EB
GERSNNRFLFGNRGRHSRGLWRIQMRSQQRRRQGDDIGCSRVPARATVRIEPSEWILAEVSSAGSPRSRAVTISWRILRALLAATCTVLQRQVRSPRGKRWEGMRRPGVLPREGLEPGDRYRDTHAGV